MLCLFLALTGCVLCLILVLKSYSTSVYYIPEDRLRGLVIPQIVLKINTLSRYTSSTVFIALTHVTYTPSLCLKNLR